MKASGRAPLKPFRETARTFTFWIRGASASLRALPARSPCSPGRWPRADMPTESGPAPGLPTFEVYGAREGLTVLAGGAEKYDATSTAMAALMKYGRFLREPNCRPNPHGQ